MTIDELKDHIDERIERMETTLLKELRKWVDPPWLEGSNDSEGESDGDK